MVRTVTAHDPAPLRTRASQGCSPWPRAVAAHGHARTAADHGHARLPHVPPAAACGHRTAEAHGRARLPPLYKAAAHDHARLPAVATATSPWTRTAATPIRSRSPWPRTTAGRSHSHEPMATQIKPQHMAAHGCSHSHSPPHHAAEVSRRRTRLRRVYPVPSPSSTAVHSALAVVKQPALGKPSAVKPPHCCWCTWAADGLLLTLAASRYCCLWGQCLHLQHAASRQIYVHRQLRKIDRGTNFAHPISSKPSSVLLSAGAVSFTDCPH